MEKFEIIKAYDNFKERLDALVKVLNLPKIEAQITSYEKIMQEDTFWNNPKQASQTIKECNNLKDQLKELREIIALNEELETIIELADESLYEEAEEIIKKITQLLERFEINQLLNEEYDDCNAIMELHPGAGGTESQDWALMLYRMYKRFSERNNFEFELIDYQEANEAGLKSVTFLLKGKHAYGKMKGEKGVHRLVRISPFDSNARRHTSFVACNVTPEIDNNIDVVLNEEDLRIDTYRSSGAGGQHVNTTDSAVRITHLPTGIVVSCQNERSQIQNKERAMQILRSKVYQLQVLENEKKVQSISGELSDNAFGSQIRSYILHPYSLVKDHRTNMESTNPNAILDGDLEEFINAYLRYIKK